MVVLKDYVKFKKGTIPLIISVPHGGTFNLESIPQRSKGILGIDKRTIEIAMELITYIETHFEEKTSVKKSPSFLISKVRRNRIDLNRPEIEAHDKNSSLGREIYRFYHQKIKNLILNNIKSFSRSLLIDIHGFEKNKRPPGYRDVEIILGTNNLNSLFLEPIPRRDWDKNIRGKIIKKFLELGVPIAPGHPRRKEYVLTGGYITRIYGASNFSGSQTIQIEFSDKIRLYDKNLRTKVLIALAELFLNDLAYLV
ncbi:MAG: hypothetical protein ACTSRI_11640 [Promethearchaeota archaeon]